MVATPKRPVKKFPREQKNIPISLALQRIQENMDLLDNVAGRTPQLTRLELILLVCKIP
jgi:hypothetical protein